MKVVRGGGCLSEAVLFPAETGLRARRRGPELMRTNWTGWQARGAFAENLPERCAGFLGR